MHRDFDDFQDEYDQERDHHSINLDHDQYGEHYDPNSENYYDLDVFSPNYAKSLFHGLGDRARYKGFNRVGEEIQLQDYLDANGNSVEIPKDNPHDLYHPNNQTVLDPTTMPDTPIDPDEFIGKVVEQLTANNVFISKDMPDLLGQMCRLFNFSIQPNNELPRSIKNLVFPAQTGIGKSVSIQVYVSMLEEHASVVIVAKVEEALNYCRYINQLSGNDSYARCYYSLTDKNIDDPMRVEASQLRNHRCIVITHNMFRRVNSFKNVEYFGKFQEKPRDFVAIDEKLSFYEQFRLDYKDLEEIINNTEAAIEDSRQFGELATSHTALAALKEFQDFLQLKEDKIVTNDRSITLRSSLTDKAQTELLASGEALTYSERSNGRQYPKKLIDIKNRSAALEILQSNGISMQTRKRNVIGISFRDVERMGDPIRKNVDPFFLERISPAVTSYLLKEPDSDEAISCTCTNLDFCSCFDDVEIKEPGEEEVQALLNDQETGNIQYGLEFVCSIVKVILESRVDELLASLEALGAYKNLSYRQNTLNAISDKIDTLRYFSKNHFLIYKSNYQKALLATENFVNQLGLSVVLDGTAQINEHYKLANRFLGHIGFVTAPQIRQYQNVTLHKAKGFSQSRSAIYRHKSSEEIQGVAESYASYAHNELNEKDKLLIICHKDFVSALKKQISDKRVEYTHWGNHIGRNEWSHCNKVMLIGWNYLPPIEHVAAINSSLDSVLLTSRHLDDELIVRFAISRLADDIVQGLMRSRARIVATDESDCEPTSFYLFYKEGDESREVFELVESQFPQAKIVDWIPDGTAIPQKKTRRNKKDDEVIDHLVLQKSNRHETYLRKDVENELGINKATMGRVTEREYFKEQMAKHGITYINTDGKSHYFALK